MACETCRRKDVADSCGSKDGKPCPCCGMVIIATAETNSDETGNK